jgi:hypothetical protein
VKLYEFYATFGFGQPNAGKYAKVNAKSKEAARAFMFQNSVKKKLETH